MDGVNSKFEIKVVSVDAKGKVTLLAKPSAGDPFTDSVNILSDRARGKFAATLCEKFPGLERAEIDSELNRVASDVAESLRPSEQTGDEQSRAELLAEADMAVDAALAAMDRDVVGEADLLLRDPLLVDRILDDIVRVGVVGEERLALMSYVLGTSRLLDKPLAAIIQGASSSGKSYVPAKVSTLFPPDAIITATDITPNALYYAPRGYLMHKWVVAGERRRGRPDDNAEATRALREMIEACELNKLITEKGENGGLRSRNINQPGPIAFSESTTLTEIFDEDANRCLLLSTDETPEQTAKVVYAQADAACGGRDDCEAIQAVHHAAQRMLKRVGVRIQYARAIADGIPKGHHEARRAMKMVLQAITAVALLHQFQRLGKPPQHGDFIHATVADYAVARKLLAGPMGRSLGGGLPDAVVRFAYRLMEAFGGDEFTSNEVHTRLGTSKSKVNEYLAALADKGTTECVEASRGNKPARWKIIGDAPEGGADWLPAPETLDPAFVSDLRFLKAGAAGQQGEPSRKLAQSAAPPPSGPHGGSSGSVDTATPAAPALPDEAWGSSFPVNHAKNGLLPRDPRGVRVACNVEGHGRGWRHEGATCSVLTCGDCHPPAGPDPVEWFDLDAAAAGEQMP